MLKEEHNSRIHLVLAIIAIAFGAVLHISRTDWLIIILCIGLVLVAEIMNSAIERLVDLVTTEHNEKAGKIKDLAAGGVLISAVIALVAGIVVFWPYIFG